MVRPSDGKTHYTERGGIPEIISRIIEADKMAADYLDCGRVRKEYGANLEGLKAVFRFVTEKIKYQKDRAGNEVIQLPSRLLKTGKGDCKSLSILIGAFLKCLGVPYFYRFSRQKGDKNYWHVYPVAVFGGQKIIMDAVIKEFNKEFPYYRKFDYPKTQISAVSGVWDVAANVLKPVPSPNYIDTVNFTDGEQRAILIYEQLNILSALEKDPSKRKAYESEKQNIKDALFVGLHTPGANKKIGSLEMVRGEIALAKKMNGARVRRKSAGIGEPIIPALNCLNETYARYEIPPPPALVDPVQWLGQRPGASDYYNDCIKFMGYREMLNDKLEKAASHLLYNYLPNNDHPQTVITKKVLHANAIDALADVTGADRDNLSLWIRNGILRETAKRGEAFQPEQVVNIIKASVRDGQIGVGGFPLAVVVGVLQIIGAAVGAAATIVSLLKQQDRQRLQSAAATIGLPNFGPLQSDYDGYFTDENGQPVTTNAGQPDFLKYALLGAGGYLLIKNL